MSIVPRFLRGDSTASIIAARKLAPASSPTPTPTAAAAAAAAPHTVGDDDRAGGGDDYDFEVGSGYHDGSVPMADASQRDAETPEPLHPGSDLPVSLVRAYASAAQAASKVVACEVIKPGTAIRYWRR